MSVDRSFIGENSRQRERLRTLVSRLSDADLRRALGEGRTIYTAMAHMAFWDRRALGMLGRWEHGEAQSPADPVGRVVTLARALHRRENSDQVERGLAG
jgi:hypothetical protein